MKFRLKNYNTYIECYCQLNKNEQLKFAFHYVYHRPDYHYVEKFDTNGIRRWEMKFHPNKLELIRLAGI